MAGAIRRFVQRIIGGVVLTPIPDKSDLLMLMQRSEFQGRFLFLAACMLSLSCGSLWEPFLDYRSPEGAATCSDGVQNGSETDVDCGGSCSACGSFTACSADGWCQFGPTRDRFYGIWGSGSHDVWAGGSYVLLHWTGTTWFSAKLGAGATRNGTFVESIWGSSPSDVWTAGFRGFTNLHWDGGQWSPDGLGPTADDLQGIWGSSAQDIWAVGFAGKVFHWNGLQWDPFGSLTQYALYSIWGSGANDVWTVGEQGKLFHWNGTQWTPVDSGTTNFLYGVWGSSANDVWAVGQFGTILHWNGTKWSLQVGTGTSTDLLGIWGSGAADIWSVGKSGTIVHWNSSQWSAVNSGTINDLNAVWGSGPRDVWAVGQLIMLHH